MVYDGNLAKVSEFETVRLGYTAQGIFCDEDYIYYAQSHSGTAERPASGTIITIYTWSGTRVGLIYVDDTTEIENVFWYDGNFYACFQGGTDYIKKLVP